MTPYTWRNFVTSSTAREGQLDQFFFAKIAFHIQIVREKARNGTKTLQKRRFYRHFCRIPQKLQQLLRTVRKSCSNFCGDPQKLLQLLRRFLGVAGQYGVSSPWLEEVTLYTMYLSPNPQPWAIFLRIHISWIGGFNTDTVLDALDTYRWEWLR